MISDETQSRGWKWRVTFILMVALILNYSARLLVSQNAVQIQSEFHTTEAGYGRLVGLYSMGFACGGLLFGVLADWLSVRWLYATVILVWSVAGLARGWVTSLDELAWCQFVMGLFMAGHWPCALRTTQRLFAPADRTLGNTILQCGASIGNVCTPMLVLALHHWDPGAWRRGFDLVGIAGIFVIIAWLRTVTDADLQRPVLQTVAASDQSESVATLQEQPFWSIFFTRRWWLLVLTVISINTIWHYVTNWVPLSLEKDHGYSRSFVQVFTALYYLGTLIGSLGAGWLSSALPRRGWSVTTTRMTVFGLCSLLTACAVPAAFASDSTTMLVCLLLVSLGTLGLFPTYYSLNQELSARHQGKVGGLLSFLSWMLLARIHDQVGLLVEADRSWRPWLLAGFGVGPLIALVLLVLCWKPARIPGTAGGTS